MRNNQRSAHSHFVTPETGGLSGIRGDEDPEEKEPAVTKLTALALGIAAWVGVAALALVIAFNMGDKNQILMFLPILAAVVVAWGIGEAVTERVFAEHKEEM